jgi:DNA-binding transcriptional LysR family regulator
MSEIETRLFRYFVALADEQHFGRAALNLSISPPTLTHQIQKLEAHVGVKLVERRGNTHLVLTEAGRRFLSRARNVLREAREAEAAAQQAARGETGRLEIGFMAVVSMSGMVAKFIGGFQKRFPGIELILQSAVTNSQINALLAGRLDFGFIRAPDNMPIGLQGFIVAHEPMVLAMPGDHSLARKKRIDPSTLGGESFINTSPDLDVGFWRHLTAVGTVGSFTPKVIRRAKDVMGMLSYVSAGQGIAVVSKAFMKMNMPNVTYREFETVAPLTAPIAFVYPEKESSPAGHVFISFMQQHRIAH